MSMNHSTLLFRRIGSIIVDAIIEFGGGLLGSYFGAMVAALVTALNSQDPQYLQQSIWRGFGFGFVFCTLSISFVNRVLIQGLSRASLGKKFFKLELVSSTRPFTWQLMIKRWVLSEVSFATGGLGYTSMFFNPEHRALHDIYLGMDVVPVFVSTYSVSMEYQYAQVLPLPLMLERYKARTIVITNDSAERPTATLIQLPLSSAALAAKASIEESGKLAEVIEISPSKKAA